MTDNNNNNPDTSAPSSPDGGNDAPDSGVKKLSNVPAILLFMAILVIASYAAFSVYEKKQQQLAVNEEEEEQVVRTASESELNNPSNTQEKIMSGIGYGLSAPETDDAPAKTELPAVTIKTENDNTLDLGERGRIPERIQTIPADDPVMQMEVDPRIADFARERTVLFKRALNAPMSVQGISAQNSLDYRKKTAANLPPKPDENSSYEEKMAYYNAVQAQIRQKQNGQGGSYEDKMKLAKSMLGIEDDNSSESDPVSVSPVAAKSTKDWDLHEGVQKSKGSLVISTGFVIPGIMISGINSDLPNSIIAQVSQNVYDSLTGQNLLIPQGTRLFGTFASQIKYGQERVFVVWDRLIFPNGQTLTLEKMPGSDVSGYSGFTDQVNNHFWKLFKHALLLSIVSGTVSYSEHHYSKDGKEYESASGAMAESFGQQMGATTTKIIEKHMDIQPTLEIRPGYQFNIIVNKDIRFSRPYRR